MLHGHQIFIDTLLASIAALTPRRIAEAEAALAKTRRAAHAMDGGAAKGRRSGNLQSDARGTIGQHEL
jgi:hypothetical protein